MAKFLTTINYYLYTYILLALLTAVGIYFTWRTKFVQGRLFKEAVRTTFAREENKEKEGLSSFQALMISTASRVGTGNIAGIATAIAAGGKGAVFWMWVMAVIGGASAFVESTLGQIYKVPDQKGFRGGPSYYMEQALHNRKLGIVFSLLLIVCFAYGFNGLQSYNVSSALAYYIPNYQGSYWPLVVAMVMTALTAVVIFGGTHRIGFVSSVLVPVMALGYLLLGVVILVMAGPRIPVVLRGIIQEAFQWKSFAGGMGGSAIVIGMKRGLFSNEAGMGSAPNASSGADVSHPVKQGLAQVLSVAIDTLLLCTTTAMMLLVSDVQGKEGVLDGIPYVQQALSDRVGTVGIHFITVAIFAFAFSSIVGNYCYAEANIRFIKESQPLLFLFRISCLVAVFLGAQASFQLIWNVADFTMGLMAIVNITVIFLLRDIAFQALEDYERQKNRGKDPVFLESHVTIPKTKCWKDEKSN